MHGYLRHSSGIESIPIRRFIHIAIAFVKKKITRPRLSKFIKKFNLYNGQVFGTQTIFIQPVCDSWYEHKMSLYVGSTLYMTVQSWN